MPPAKDEHKAKGRVDHDKDKAAAPSKEKVEDGAKDQDPAGGRGEDKAGNLKEPNVAAQEKEKKDAKDKYSVRGRVDDEAADEERGASNNPTPKPAFGYDEPKTEISAGEQLKLARMSNGNRFIVTSAILSVKVVVTVGLRLLPRVGRLLSSLSRTMRRRRNPGGGGGAGPEISFWEQIREEVEALVNERIAQAIFTMLSARLDGLLQVVDQYLDVLNNGGSNASIHNHWVAANTQFVVNAPSFMIPEYEWQNAVLFSQFSTLHGSLLRDAVLHGAEWGLSPNDIAIYTQRARATFDEYDRYFNTIHANRRRVHEPTPPIPERERDPSRVLHHNHWHTFNWQWIDMFGDFQVLLRSLNPITFPGTVAEIPFEELHSLAYSGTPLSWPNLGFRDTAFVTGRVWAGPYSRPLQQAHTISTTGVPHLGFTPSLRDVPVSIMSVVMSFRPNQGPLRARMEGEVPNERVDHIEFVGGAWGRIHHEELIAARGITEHVPIPPSVGRFGIVSAEVITSRTAGIEGLSLVMNQHGVLRLWHCPGNNQTRHRVGFEGRAITALNMWGLNEHRNPQTGEQLVNLGCISFVFSMDTETNTEEALRTLYVASPKLYADVEQEVKGDISELKRAREAYWGDIRKTCEGREAGKHGKK